MTLVRSMVALAAIGLVGPAPRPAWSRPLELSMTVPREVTTGEMFDVPIAVFDGRHALVSYALRLEFDPKILKVVAIHGGTARGLEHDPVTDPASFDSGRVDFVANTRAFVSTPRSFPLATVKLLAIAPSSEPARLQLGLIPGNGLVTKRRFKLVRTRLLGRAKLIRVK